MINRSLLALFSRPAMRCNPRSWLQWFGDPQLKSMPRIESLGNGMYRNVATIVYSTATVGTAPAWAVR